MIACTTEDVGEEDFVTTLAVGEEDTTFGLGEEEATTLAVGEEEVTTHAVGEEGGPIGPETATAFGAF